MDYMTGVDTGLSNESVNLHYHPIISCILFHLRSVDISSIAEHFAAAVVLSCWCVFVQYSYAHLVDAS